MTREQRRNDEHQEERRKKNSDCRYDRTPKPSNEVTDKGRRNYNRSRADHAYGNRDQKLALIQPAELLNKALFEEGYDDEATTKGERARLEKEQQKLAQDRAGGARCELCQNGQRSYRKCCRRRRLK